MGGSRQKRRDKALLLTQEHHVRKQKGVQSGASRGPAVGGAPGWAGRDFSVRILFLFRAAFGCPKGLTKLSHTVCEEGASIQLSHIDHYLEDIKWSDLSQVTGLGP